ncbi:cobyric acid synthase [Thermodesulfobacterium hydrogeniphilum]|uniref:cobyric acid synthase n=1 Tax=Thermodesulfobacterium hydrogeniphilum TaxID=161156 RepID=UPI0005705F7D|nr:cobyric acid synthase [Thermodesulfobacterium hydrogeniphilum]
MAKALMIQGTSSGAGKSLLVTALCRIAKNLGFKVAPFKAQNMSLQSFITKNGGEIGLAQALQAMSAGLEPEIHMNPILLKADGNKGSQVIIHGKVYKTLKPKEYYAEKKKLWNKVLESLEYLKKHYELLIVEGAGSPAEINLRDSDIVNMAVAEYLKAPVILVGDIDKGGVFASLYGTIKLVGKSEKLIKGFIINKFRGDVEILKPGIREIEKLCQKPCLGVLPYFEELSLSSEDSLGLSYHKTFSSEKNKLIKIVVLRLKYISNFSDFDPLKYEPDVELLYSLRKEELLSADVVIIPGSKRTVEDLLWLKSLKIDKILKYLAEKGVEIIGLCGGFQMLGKILKDPEKVESDLKEIKGLGLLDIETTFYPKKITTQAEGYCNLKENLKIWGYEIHMGESEGDLNLFTIKRFATKEIKKEGSQKESIWGTYLHGIFENDDFRRFILNKVREKKGLTPLEKSYSYKKLREITFNTLAKLVETHLNMEKIWSLIKL